MIFIGNNNISFSNYKYYMTEGFMLRKILGTLDIKSKWGLLISGVVHSFWSFLGLVKAAKIFFV